MGRMLSKKACMNCRRRHLKCDEELPTCRRCRRANLPCDHRVRHEFRSVSFHPDDVRQADDTVSHFPALDRLDGIHSGSVPYFAHTFIDETGRVSAAFETQDVSTQASNPTALQNADEPSFEATTYLDDTTMAPLSDLSPAAARVFDNPPSIIGLPLAANINHITSFQYGGFGGDNEQQRPGLDVTRQLQTGLISSAQQLPAERQAPASVLRADSLRHPAPSAVTVASPARGVSLSSFAPLPTIAHPREAYLVKFFTQTWGPIFDCLDANLTFTKSVVQIALTSNQPLLWAILATSALQLSRVSDYPFAAAQHYRSRCSASIMPILLRPTEPGAGEETLFATYVMLRNYEHMTECFSGQDPDTLFTAALAISANPSDMITQQADVGRAAFWVHLRQDIHVALLLQIPIRTDYPPCLQTEKILADLNAVTGQQASVRQEVLDCAWANRVVSLLLDIINYCFNSGPRDLDAWILLRSRLDHWSMAKPTNLKPYYERARDVSAGRVFPEIWMSSDCHVLAWLYYHAARVLLKTYPPYRGSDDATGPLIESLESGEEVLLHARAICGIAMTNPNAQALIVVCHMVTISAIFFTEETDQKETMNLLRMAHSVTGHPYEDIERKLRTYWADNRRPRFHV